MPSRIKQFLKADSYMLGFGLPDDNIHSPDEKFSLDAYMAGMKMGAHLWPESGLIGRSLEELDLRHKGVNLLAPSHQNARYSPAASLIAPLR